MNNAKTKKKLTVSSPDLGDSSRFAIHPSGEPLKSEEYSQTSFNEIDWAAQTASNVCFEEVLLKSVKLSESKLKNLKVRDSIISNSDISVANCLGASFQRVEILTTRLSGFNSAESRYEDVLFKGCTCKYATFQFSTFANCRFEDCDLQDVTFQGAKLTNVTFRNCNMTNSQFGDVRLSNVDVCGSNISAIQIPLNELKNLTIDSSQATVIAVLTQVKIENDYN